MQVGQGRGRFITLEGGEGAGKSTQTRLLAERLQAAGRSALATREPGGSPSAEAIRQVLLSGATDALSPLGQALLVSAARSDHLDRTIRPALRAGTWVVCDRFANSTRAYQGVVGRVDRSTIEGLERIVVGDTVPDLTLVLDLPAAMSLDRARRRSGAAEADRFERATIEFHQAVRSAFRDIAAAEPGRCAMIDASGRPEAVTDAIWAIVAARLCGREGEARPAARKLPG